MGRLGGGTKETSATAELVEKMPEVELEGLWTHFACADDPERRYTEGQLAGFHEAISALERAGIQVPLKTHRPTRLRRSPTPNLTSIWCGLGLRCMGITRALTAPTLPPDLTPVMTLSAPVTFVKRIQKGQSLSYGALWTAPKDTTIATVRFGYADGYPRALSTTPAAQVRLCGQLRPIVGRVCMDQLMVDVGESDVQVGDPSRDFRSGRANR